ncbi:hypothetical protein RvY_15423-2 [Ramazzottius varieornatus]|uniref:Uncharacterized protein n=1 Tax=Ramazzottius varieornatus TaxID=947166 RepID=A0A1D1VWG6_RAMVA|nr:hypothetical protein RvY_15423-2 [Ramazzottius varieornatus]
MRHVPVDSGNISPKMVLRPCRCKVVRECPSSIKASMPFPFSWTPKSQLLDNRRVCLALVLLHRSPALMLNHYPARVRLDRLQSVVSSRWLALSHREIQMHL